MRPIRGIWLPSLSSTVPTVRPVSCHYCSVEMQRGTRFATVSAPRRGGQRFGLEQPCCESCVYGRVFETQPYVVDGIEVPGPAKVQGMSGELQAQR